MDWVVAGSAFAGTFSSVVILFLMLLIWLYFDERKNKSTAAETNQKAPKPKTFQEDVLERHLEELIINNFDDLFPGWSVYNADANSNGTKPSGIRLRTLDAGEIDILCIDEKNDLVVVELKRNQTPDQVVTQTDRYITWVGQNIAQAGQAVRGIIIAKSHSSFVVHSTARRDDIELWTYDIKLTLAQMVQTSSAVIDSSELVLEVTS